MFWNCLGIFPVLGVSYYLKMDFRLFSYKILVIPPLEFFILLLVAFLFSIKYSIHDNYKKTLYVFKYFRLILIIFACKFAEPAIPSSVRTLEVPLGIATEAILFSIFPDLLTYIGTAIALICVISIACYDRIFGRFLKANEPDFYDTKL